MSRVALREHVAEPANLWIRHSFSGWPISAGTLWCDLATGGLPQADRGSPPTGSQAASAVRQARDVVYVPPVAATNEDLRARVLAAADQAGTPLLIQVAADFDPRTSTFFVPSPPTGKDLGGGASAEEGRSNDVRRPSGRRAGRAQQAVVVDLLDSLVSHAASLRAEFRRSRQPRLPFGPPPFAGTAVVWPLIAGWTDGAELLAAAFPRLAAAGARSVVSRTLLLGASERRLLAERLQPVWPEAFDALFHGGDAEADVGPFRRAAEAAGLQTRLPRPLPGPPLPHRLRRARELAGLLIERGDAAGSEALAYYRAARFIDRGSVDIDAAAREGNLGVLPWLEEPARRVVEQWVAGG